MTQMCLNQRPYDEDGTCTCGGGHQQAAAVADDFIRIATHAIRIDPICPGCRKLLQTGDHKACVEHLVDAPPAEKEAG
jgi:hypothetical protein